MSGLLPGLNVGGGTGPNAEGGGGGGRVPQTAGGPPRVRIGHRQAGKQWVANMCQGYNHHNFVS